MRAVALSGRRSDARVKLDGGGTYVVTGVPVLADDLTDVLAGSTLRLLLVAVAVMALVLALLFRSRLRLLPLAIALAGRDRLRRAGAARAAADDGLDRGAAGAAGLAVDYAIQYQARAGEDGSGAGGTGDRHRRAGHGGRLPDPAALAGPDGARVRRAARRGRRVGLVLTLTAGTAVLMLAARRRASDGSGRARCAARASSSTARRARPRAVEPDAGCGSPARRPPPVRAVRAAGAGPRARRSPCGIRGCSVARLASAAGRWTPGSRWCPSCRGSSRRISPAVRDLDALQRDTGVAGEVDVLVEASDLTDPKVIAWMRDYQDEVLTRHGYNAAKGCAGGELCPALSLPDLFRTPELSATRAQIRALLDAVPPYFSQAAITPDRRTAVLAFGIRLQSLEAQRAVIQDMRKRLRPAARREGDRRRPARAGRRRQPRAERSAAAAADRAGRPGWRSRSRCSRSTARGRGRGCRWCRSRSPRAGPRWCSGCSACR